MSGIAGFIHFNGAPPDPALARQMAGALDFRGPHARHVEIRQPAALVHTLLKTTFESEFERQPASLDGEVWITADARIDGREDLVRELGLGAARLAAPDCELILEAYRMWGEGCVEHLLGDFAFAIWDARERKLFCARDHFGIKPFYYAETNGAFVFSNTLACVRLHPGLGDELNEQAIADFLIFDYNQDPGTTTFRDIRRLPPAHTLTVSTAGSTLRRYWSLPEGERIRYRRTRDYVEHFRHLLEIATADRLRTRRVAVMMSGGLDSPAVAAFARKARAETDIDAYTWISESLIHDNEREFAGLVAKRLGIRIEYIPIDGQRPFAPVKFSTPEPVHAPRWEYTAELRRRIQHDTPVILTGYGADPLLTPSPFLNWRSVFEVPVVNAGINFLRYAIEFRAVPKIRLRSTLKAVLGNAPLPSTELPQWLDPAFVRRNHLAQRALECREIFNPSELRPSARRYMRSIFWTRLFETDDAAWTGSATECRHPFFDTRIVRYCLAIPELPYAMDKYLLRLALQGLVPEAVRRRPKTRAQADPLYAAFRKFGLPAEQPFRLHPGVSRFINAAAVPGLNSDCSADDLWVHSRPISLNDWITSWEGKYDQCTRELRTSEMVSTGRH